MSYPFSSKLEETYMGVDTAVKEGLVVSDELLNNINDVMAKDLDYFRGDMELVKVDVAAKKDQDKVLKARNMDELVTIIHGYEQIIEAIQLSIPKTQESGISPTMTRDVNVMECVRLYLALFLALYEIVAAEVFKSAKAITSGDLRGFISTSVQRIAEMIKLIMLAKDSIRNNRVSPLMLKNIYSQVYAYNNNYKLPEILMQHMPAPNVISVPNVVPQYNNNLIPIANQPPNRNDAGQNAFLPWNRNRNDSGVGPDPQLVNNGQAPDPGNPYGQRPGRNDDGQGAVGPWNRNDSGVGPDPEFVNNGQNPDHPENPYGQRPDGNNDGQGALVPWRPNTNNVMTGDIQGRPNSYNDEFDHLHSKLDNELIILNKKIDTIIAFLPKLQLSESNMAEIRSTLDELRKKIDNNDSSVKQNIDKLINVLRNSLPMRVPNQDIPLISSTKILPKDEDILQQLRDIYLSLSNDNDVKELLDYTKALLNGNVSHAVSSHLQDIADKISDIIRDIDDDIKRKIINRIPFNLKISTVIEDFDTIKDKLKNALTSGDYDSVAKYFFANPTKDMIKEALKLLDLSRNKQIDFLNRYLNYLKSNNGSIDDQLKCIAEMIKLLCDNIGESVSLDYPENEVSGQTATASPVQDFIAPPAANSPEQPGGVHNGQGGTEALIPKTGRSNKVEVQIGNKPPISSIVSQGTSMSRTAEVHESIQTNIQGIETIETSLGQQYTDLDSKIQKLQRMLEGLKLNGVSDTKPMNAKLDKLANLIQENNQTLKDNIDEKAQKIIAELREEIQKILEHNSSQHLQREGKKGDKKEDDEEDGVEEVVDEEEDVQEDVQEKVVDEEEDEVQEEVVDEEVEEVMLQLRQIYFSLTNDNDAEEILNLLKKPNNNTDETAIIKFINDKKITVDKLPEIIKLINDKKITVDKLPFNFKLSNFLKDRNEVTEALKKALTANSHDMVEDMFFITPTKDSVKEAQSIFGLAQHNVTFMLNLIQNAVNELCPDRIKNI